MSVRIASWNICLGLINKKDYVYKTVKVNNIDICLLQEVEIGHDYDHTLLTEKDLKIKVEKNDIKLRSAIIIRDNIMYERRQDLEGKNLGIVIIDLNGNDKYRIVNVYRSFNPPNNVSQLSWRMPST